MYDKTKFLSLADLNAMEAGWERQVVQANSFEPDPSPDKGSGYWIVFPILFILIIAFIVLLDKYASERKLRKRYQEYVRTS